jgi:hypothetical protein
VANRNNTSYTQEVQQLAISSYLGFEYFLILLILCKDLLGTLLLDLTWRRLVLGHSVMLVWTAGVVFMNLNVIGHAASGVVGSGGCRRTGVAAMTVSTSRPVVVVDADVSQCAQDLWTTGGFDEKPLVSPLGKGK